MTEKEINWNNFLTHQKRGSCCVKVYEGKIDFNETDNIRTHWVIDTEIPVFRGDGREYIEELIWLSNCNTKGESE